jgi:hypothetical protein
MIYKDIKSVDDSSYCPGKRGMELCINCDDSWMNHHGWHCHHSPAGGRLSFDMIKESARYLTQSMLNSIGRLSPKQRRKRKPKKEIPNIPLDTELSVLQAGYLQDRQRKRYKKKDQQ